MSSRFTPILLLAVACALFVLAYQPQQPIMLDVTAPSSEKFLDNFFAPERDARWTQAHSAVWLTGLGGGNLAWRVGVRLSGARPNGVTAPHVVVRANGAMLAEFSALIDERAYEWSIAPWQLGANGDLLLEIDSDTFSPQSDPRELGVRVARVWLTRGDGLALPSLKTFLLLLALVTEYVLVARNVLSADGGRQTADLRRPSPIVHRPSSIVVATLVVLVAAAALALNRAETTWWLGVLTLSALFVAALAWLVAHFVSISSLTRRQQRNVLAVFALAALVRLALDTGRGYEGDVAIYLSLAWKTVHFGIQSAYLNVSAVPPPNTPPFLLYPFWLLGWLFQQLISPLFPPTWLNDPDGLRFMLRLPSLSADLIAGALIFRALQRESLSFNARLLASSAYLFNPALIFDSAYWGQTAAIHSLFMLVALLATERHAFGWAGVAMATAVLTKPQALAIAPLVVVLAWRERGLFRLLIGGLVAAVLVDLPFIAAGTMDGVAQQYIRTSEYHPFIALNAHNWWWFSTGGQGWQSDSLPLGPLTFRSVGVLLFACATLLSLIVVWRDRKRLFAVAAFQSLAFFMLATQIHENHLLPMFAPLVLAAVKDTSAWWLYGAFTVTALANMALHDPNLVTALGYPAEEIYGGPALALPRWLNAAAQTMLFFVFALRLSAPLLHELKMKKTSRVSKTREV